MDAKPQPRLRTQRHEVDICVVGGGLAGIAAAVAAARSGARTLIVQDRPMFGGNASSEVRMWVCGAHGWNNRETGIVEELALENLRRNPHKNYAVWDAVLYGLVRFQDDLDYLLNCSCLDAEMADGRIRSISCWQMTSQCFHEVHARFFIDCSGDSILAPLSGAPYRHGREGRDEYGESIAPEAADRYTMGNSCLIQLRETREPRQFVAPDWAEELTEENSAHRPCNPLNPGENFWYLELGGMDDTIADAEAIRDELQDLAWGFADYLKNRAPWAEALRHYDVDWIGMLPGKRESRRYVGAYVMTQADVEAGGRFEDTVAYGGWTMDDHHPGGWRSEEPATIHHPAPSPFGIPWRCLYSLAVPNLLFAGRNISVTHSAMSATRVMATCATLGQAAGTGAALAVHYDCDPDAIGREYLDVLQQRLLRDDSYLPGIARRVPEPAQRARYRLLQADGQAQSDPTLEWLRNGADRPSSRDEPQCWTGPLGSTIEVTLEAPRALREIRMVFDSDLERETLPEAEQALHRGMEAIHRLSHEPLHLPHTLMRAYRVELEDEDGQRVCIADERRNARRLVLLTRGAAATPWPARTIRVRLTLEASWGVPEARLFSLDVD